jgi:heme exporter protein A
VDALTSERPGLFLLDFDNVAFSRGRSKLFSGLHFSVYPGQVIWLQGHNGQGKTSVLKLAMRLAQPVAGVIRWGTAFDHGGAPTYIGHLNGQSVDLKVQESLTYSARMHGAVASADAVANALKRTSLYALRNRLVHSLSQGERRRLALTRLLLNQSALWVLDEPLDALDTASTAMVLDLIEEQIQNGGAVLMSSHIPFHATDLQVLDLAALHTP